MDYLKNLVLEKFSTLSVYGRRINKSKFILRYLWKQKEWWKTLLKVRRDFSPVLVAKRWFSIMLNFSRALVLLYILTITILSFSDVKIQVVYDVSSFNRKFKASWAETPHIFIAEHGCFRDLTFFSAGQCWFKKQKQISLKQFCFRGDPLWFFLI